MFIHRLTVFREKVVLLATWHYSPRQGSHRPVEVLHDEVTQPRRSRDRIITPNLAKKDCFFCRFFRSYSLSAHRWVRCPFWNHSRGGWFVDYLFCFPGVRETICMVDGWRMHTHPLGSKYNAVHYQLLRINSSTKHTNQHFAFHPNCDYYSGVVVLMLAVAFLPLAVCSDWHVCNKNVWFDFDLMLFVIFYHVQTTTD